MSKRYLVRAITVGASTLVSALLVYQVPPSIEGWWQPLLLAVQAALVQLGVNGATRTPRPGGQARSG